MANGSISLPRIRFSLRQQDARTAWLLIAPSLLVLLGITFWPVLSTFILDFARAISEVDMGAAFQVFGKVIPRNVR